MTTSISLNNIVLFSNSIPKSGSSLLFNLQRELLCGVAGRNSQDYDFLSEAGISSSGGFIFNSDIPKLAKFLMKREIQDGPYVFKIHHPINDALRDLFLSRYNVFISLSIRDPEDVLLSARDNHLKTGEFAEFKNLDSGCDTINGWFQDIYNSCVNTSLLRNIPIVKYEDIIIDNVMALFKSFHIDLFNSVLQSVAKKFLDFDRAYKLASIRFNKPGSDHRNGFKNSEEFSHYKEKLSAFREKMGYPNNLVP